MRRTKNKEWNILGWHYEKIDVPNIEKIWNTANIAYCIRELDGQLLSQMWYEKLPFDINMISSI